MYRTRRHVAKQILGWIIFISLFLMIGLAGGLENNQITIGKCIIAFLILGAITLVSYIGIEKLTLNGE